MSTRFLVPLIAVLGLAACATAPKPLQGQFPTVSPSDSTASARIGTSVRWGGKIIKTTPGQDQTCFELISRPLNASGRPDRYAMDTSDGRFLACRSGFYDPAVFEPGREVTFIGKIEGYETTKIGEYDYKLPKVNADVVYLWPVVRDVDVVPAYRPYDPWGDPWGTRWGGGWGWGWGRGWW